MDSKIGKGQSGGYDQPTPSFEEFKSDYGLKLAQDLDRNIASEGQNLDVEHLQEVYPQYYKVCSMIEEAKRQELTPDEFLKKCEPFLQMRKSNREQLERAKTASNSTEIPRLQSIENFYQILGNDIHVTNLYLEDQEIKPKKK